MDRRQFLATTAATTVTVTTRQTFAQRGATGSDWAQWRGPGGTAAVPKQTAPVNWSNSQNIKWKTRMALPGSLQRSAQQRTSQAWLRLFL